MNIKKKIIFGTLSCLFLIVVYFGSQFFYSGELSPDIGILVLALLTLVGLLMLNNHKKQK